MEVYSRICRLHTNTHTQSSEIYSSTLNSKTLLNSFSFHYFYNKFPTHFQFIDPFASSSNSVNAFFKTKQKKIE